VALIGENGAGKSTMLSLVTGLAKPDTGSVKVNGRVAALLALGSGFHPDLTGEENVYMNAALLGFSERQAKARFASIVEFSEIGKFIDEPIRTYSSGMVVRLAFAIAVHVDPAILIVDEVLSVGDAHFQDKCMKKIADLRKQGITMLSVSHDPSMVLNFCDRAIWLHKGELIRDGNAAPVLQDYANFVADPSAGLPVPDRAAFA
jgi:ABC-type polysaccharide/polyol phosphate transport system ATPase subunit